MYIIIELQTDSEGNVGNIITSFESRSDAENKYHVAAAYAAVSSVPVHAVIFIDNRGKQIEPPCVFYHAAQEEE